MAGFVAIGILLPFAEGGSPRWIPMRAGGWGTRCAEQCVPVQQQRMHARKHGARLRNADTRAHARAPPRNNRDDDADMEEE